METENTKKITVQIVLDPALAERLEEAARLEGETKSVIARRIFREYFGMPIISRVFLPSPSTNGNIPNDTEQPTTEPVAN